MPRENNSIEVEHVSRLSSLIDRIAERVRRDPDPIVAGALLVGAVSGAGLWSKLGRALLGAGVRVAIAALVPPVVNQLVEKMKHERTNGRAS